MLIDLSVPLNEKTPFYPGDPATKIKKAGILLKDGYQDHYVCVGTHVGTHMDAPSHMIKGGKNLDKFPLERFVGRGISIKTGRKIDMKSVINAGVKAGDFVFFNTGMSKRYHTSAYYDNYSAIPEEVANYLVKKKVNAVGVDMCSVDHPPFPVHKIFLKNNILIIENLTNLSALPTKSFKVYAFPIKLELDGAPTRVVAEIS